MAVALLAAATPAAVRAQPPSERTGPLAAPIPRPGFPNPAAGLVPPAGDAAPSATAPSAEEGLTEVRIAGDEGQARPPRGWRPPQEPQAGLGLDYEPGQHLDVAWVHHQFERNGLTGPSVGISRALALVQLINRAFLSAGFLNSGLVARAGASADILDLRLVYGALAAPADGAAPLSVQWAYGGAKGLDLAYVRDRLPSASMRPLSGVDLERDFRLLAADPAIRTVNADLRPGARPGEASLALSIYPQDRFDLYATGGNTRSPSVGGERAALGGSGRNLFAPGDLMSGEVGVTRGLKDAALGYALPFFSARDTLSVRAALNDAAVVDRALSPLDITAHDRSVEIGLTHKFIDAPLLPLPDAGGWSPARTLTGGILLTRRVSRTYLLGEPFSFSAGSVEGRTGYGALRLVGDYLVRSVDQVFALSLTASRGLGGSGSDLPGLPTPKPHFDVLLAQVNYARRLSATGLELRARLSGQMADSVLYSGERFSAGGESTVRGYRENLLLADGGVIGSLELARPLRLTRGQGGAGRFDWGAFSVAGFVDGAALRSRLPPQPQPAIYSVGASLAWTPSDAVLAQVTYGRAFKAASFSGMRNIQDRGLSFLVTVHPLRLRR